MKKDKYAYTKTRIATPKHFPGGIPEQLGAFPLSPPCVNMALLCQEKPINTSANSAKGWWDTAQENPDRNY